MSTQAHSPSPWRVEESTYVVDAESISVADCYLRAISSPSDAANAAHIVKCVNGWDDIDALRARLAELGAA